MARKYQTLYRLAPVGCGSQLLSVTVEGERFGNVLVRVLKPSVLAPVAESINLPDPSPAFAARNSYMACGASADLLRANVRYANSTETPYSCVRR